MGEMIIRVAAILVGLVLFGAGIGALFLADLGVGPWDVLHDALAGLLDRQPGTVIVGLGVVLLGLVVGLRQPIGLATVANVAIIGSTVNVVLAVVDTPSAMAVRLVLVAAAPMMVAFGSMLYIGGGLGIGVRDGLMMALVDAGLSLRVARTMLEATVLVVGGALEPAKLEDDGSGIEGDIPMAAEEVSDLFGPRVGPALSLKLTDAHRTTAGKNLQTTVQVRQDFVAALGR